MPLHILLIGATGSVGRQVTAEALAQGYRVSALSRSTSRAATLPNGVHKVIGDLSHAETLADALHDIDAVIFTHGSDGMGKAGSQSVDYGGVRNVLFALRNKPVRVVLMTAIGVTNRDGSYNRRTEAHDWKRRAERLVRASGHPYTIVRPGWFDYNAANEQQLQFLQGDRRQSGTPADGGIARRQLAQVLVASVSCDDAVGKTFELIANRGPAPQTLTPLFAALTPDTADNNDGVFDTANMPLQNEPAQVLSELEQIAASRT
jgi:uncharacterized protein YbjT (DUF2867 family)